MANRVVITSKGVISPIGDTDEKVINTLKNPAPRFERPDFDREVAVCPIHEFNLKNYTGRYKDARYLNRGVRFAVAAAMIAISRSGIREQQLEAAGLFAGAGPNLDISGEFPEITHGGISDTGLPALWILKFLPNTTASAIARIAGIHGENITAGSACAASLSAIGEAFRKVKDGYLSHAFAGGGDSRLSPGGILAYKKAQALWAGEGDPETDYGPFGRNRTGFIPGEGGAFFLLESLESAEQRGAKILAEVCGFGSSIDGYNMTAPRPDGKWAEKAVTGALKEAGVAPSDIDLISPHGTGTQLNDAMEADLIERLFPHHPHVIALKSWMGHIASSCGAVELGIVLSCLETNYWPQVKNLTQTCNETVNFVKKPVSLSPETILLENFGFGGQNAALVIKKWND